MMYGEPTQGKAIATQNSLIMCLKRDAFEYVVKKQHTYEINRTLSQLKTFPLFQCALQRTLDHFAGKIVLERFESGSVI